MNGYRETAWRAEDVRPTIFQHFNDFAAKPVWLRLGDNLYGRVNPFFSDRGLDRRYLRSAPLRRFHQWLSNAHGSQLYHSNEFVSIQKALLGVRDYFYPNWPYPPIFFLTLACPGSSRR